MSKKEKIVVTAIVLIFVIIGGTAAYVFSHVAKIQETDFTVPYGQKVKITSMDIYGKDVDADINLSTISNEAGKNYPDIGEYTGTVTYNGMTSNLTIHVVDHEKPKWIKAPSKVKIGLYQSKYNFKKNFKANDPSRITYSFDTSEVNFNKSGTYNAVAKAKDSHGNVAKKKFKVEISYAYDSNDFEEDGSTSYDGHSSKKSSNTSRTKNKDISYSNNQSLQNYNSGYYNGYQ